MHDDIVLTLNEAGQPKQVDVEGCIQIKKITDKAKIPLLELISELSMSI